MKMEPKFFKKPADFRKWLEKNHMKETELLVGFYKKGTGKESITWPESVDEALCYGWIDGIRKSFEEDSYTIRFTPRKPTSIWSAVNIANIERLTKEGRMKPAGIAAHEKRKEHKTAIYSFEQSNKDLVLTKEYETIFKKNKKAWEFFQNVAPSYRRPAIWWVISAKREETRLKRLNELIADSEAGSRVKHLRR